MNADQIRAMDANVAGRDFLLREIAAQLAEGNELMRDRERDSLTEVPTFEPWNQHEHSDAGKYGSVKIAGRPVRIERGYVDSKANKSHARIKFSSGEVVDSALWYEDFVGVKECCP